MIPESVLLSAESHSVTGEAIRLLLALAAQYKGRNNGNLCAALSVLRQYGFNSADTIARALAQLTEAGLIIRTREGAFQGESSKCALYAVAWKAIDECPGKDLTVSPTKAPPRLFLPAGKTKRPVRKSDTSRSENRSEAARQ